MPAEDDHNEEQKEGGENESDYQEEEKDHVGSSLV